MLETLKISRWQKSKMRKMFKSYNSKIVTIAYNPNTRKVRPVSGTNNLQDEDQPVAVVQAVVQPIQLEVIVTDQQHTVTFNNDQVNSCEQVQIEQPKAK